MKMALLALEAFLHENKKNKNKILPPVRTELGISALLFLNYAIRGIFKLSFFMHHLILGVFHKPEEISNIDTRSIMLPPVGIELDISAILALCFPF